MKNEIFDGNHQDILKCISNEPKFFIDVNSIIKNRVNIRISEELFESVKKQIIAIISQSEEYLKSYEKRSRNSQLKYILGVRTAISTTYSYLEKISDIYELSVYLSELAESIESIGSIIIENEKPYYAGFYSGLLNLIEVIEKTIHDIEISQFEFGKQEEITR